MAGLSYPPWSAPSTMERDKKKEKSNKKWTNVKRTFMKPWQKKAGKQQPRPTQDRSALPPPAGLEQTSSQRLDFGEFSPFGHGRQKINPLSGGGNPFLFHQLTGGGFPNYQPASKLNSEKASPYEKRREEEASSGLFDPPTPKSSRPALSNIFPIYDKPKLQKTPSAAVHVQKKQMKTPSSVKPAQATKPLIHRRRSSSPSVSGMAPSAFSNRKLPTSARSTTSDITDERMGKKEHTRRASAIRVLPLLPPAERSPPSDCEEGNSDLDDSDEAWHVMYHSPPNSAHSGDNDSAGMYMCGWTQQPNEQLQKLEEELEGEGPEGEAADTRIMQWELQIKSTEELGANSNWAKEKSKDFSKFTAKGGEPGDFAQEFVRQLTLGGNESDVLY